MRAIEGELAANRYGAAVRLEVAHNCPDELTQFLLGVFEIDDDDLYRVDGPVNLNRLLAIYDMLNRPDLKYANFTPGIPAIVRDTSGIFNLLRKQDLLLHHPYESFMPVAEMINIAAQDPDVVAIKLTLYRAGRDSLIVDRLVAAAEAGKEITVLVELRARFDEVSNIAFANRLQEVGAHVVHGVVGYKTHCKMALIVRREGGSLKRYAHLGTGNYHPGTARAYTDYGLLTADESLTEDVHHVFLQLTSMAKTPPLNRLIQAPFELHRQLMRLIEQEIENVTNGGTGYVIAKVNALTEPEVIAALYRASSAGVMVDLIVRGICCLRPGLAGTSDNIRVRSIIGRFLEHSRVYYFHAGGKEIVYCASADLMERNLFRRVEVGFPISEPEMRQRIIADLDLCLQDNIGAWELSSDGTWEKRSPNAGEDPVSVQQILLRKLAEAAN